MPTRWSKLRVVFDEFLEIDDLPKGTREDIYDAIRRYAETGAGGTVLLRATDIEYDVIVVSGYEIEFDIYRDGPPEPTMYVYLVEPAKEEDRED